MLESIAASAFGRDVVGFSLITNVRLTGEPTSHEDVLAAPARSAEGVARLVEGTVANLGQPPPSDIAAAEE